MLENEYLDIMRACRLTRCCVKVHFHSLDQMEGCLPSNSSDHDQPALGLPGDETRLYDSTLLSGPRNRVNHGYLSTSSSLHFPFTGGEDNRMGSCVAA